MTRFLLVLGLSGCGTGVLDVYEQCDVEVVLAPTEGLPGATVVATGGPFSKAYDTVVTVAGVQAEVDAVERTDCDACDSCRDEANCLACGACTECTEDCSSCLETTTFTVPAAEPGASSVRLLNRFGGSAAVPFTVLGADSGDTGPLDTNDTAPVDTGARHTGDTAGPDTSETGRLHTGDTATHRTGDTAALHTGDTASPSSRDTSAVHTGDTATADTSTTPTGTGS